MRHGRSLADDEQVYEGRYDSPLTERGRQQLEQRARDFQAAGLHFDLVIASTLQRAQSSAQIIATQLGLTVVTDPDWMEMDNGPLPRLSFAEAERRYPTPAFRNPYEPFCETGESSWQLYCRAARAVENVIRRGPGSYLVVAHGMILNDALRTICASGPAVNHSGIFFSFADAGYASLRYNPSRHQWILMNFVRGFID